MVIHHILHLLMLALAISFVASFDETNGDCPAASPRATIHHVDELSAAVKHYEEHGYAILRGVLDPRIIEEIQAHVDYLLEKFPDIPGEHFHHHIMRNDAFWVRFISDERLLNVATAFAPFLQNDEKSIVRGEEMTLQQMQASNIALFSSHYFIKKPKTGKEVLWHQDGSYWPLKPMDVVTLWIAVDAVDESNGCLRLLSGSHNDGLAELQDTQSKKDGSDVLGSATHTEEEIDQARVVNVVMEPGDIEIHHAAIVHASTANTHETRRRAGRTSERSEARRKSKANPPPHTQVTARYISPNTECWDDTQPVLMFRGNENATVKNKYRSWPKYREGFDMPFVGSGEWNERRKVVVEDEAYFERVDFQLMDKETEELVMGFVNELGGK